MKRIDLIRAAASRSRKRRGPICSECGGTGHNRRTCPLPAQRAAALEGDGELPELDDDQGDGAVWRAPAAHPESILDPHPGGDP